MHPVGWRSFLLCCERKCAIIQEAIFTKAVNAFMHRVLCSTGTLLGRPNGRNYNLLLSLEKELQCDGLELMFYDTWYDQVDALSEVIGKLHLPIVAFHGEKNICASLVKEETY